MWIERRTPKKDLSLVPSCIYLKLIRHLKRDFRQNHQFIFGSHESTSGFFSKTPLRRARLQPWKRASLQFLFEFPGRLFLFFFLFNTLHITFMGNEGRPQCADILRAITFLSPFAAIFARRYRIELL